MQMGHGREAALSKKSKAQRSLWRAFKGSIEQYTPIEVRDLPNKPMYAIGTMVLLSYVILFVSFCVTSYTEQVKTKFLVPMGQDVPGAECQDIPSAITTSYIVDSSGRYSGLVGFNYNATLYNIEFNNLKVTTAEYASLMQQVRQSYVELIGQNAATSTLNLNIVMWLSSKYVFKDSSGSSLNIFSFEADVATVFYNSASIPITFFMQSRDKQCTAARYANFDRSSYLLSVSFNAIEYNQSAACNDIVDLRTLYGTGFINIITLETYPALNQKTNTYFDMRSYLTALAINLDVFSTEFCAGDLFNCLESTQDPTSGDGYTIYYLIDPRYIGMTPLGCIQMDGSTQYICSVRFGGTFGLPVLNMLGSGSDLSSNDFIYRTICDCSSSNADNEYCDNFYFLVSLLVYPKGEETNSDDGGNNNAVDLAIQYANNYAQLIKDAFQATVPRQVSQTEQGDGMADFDFCFINGQYCNALSYLVSNNNGINPLNQYYKALINGSCSADQFLVSDDAWNNIYQGPPISLTENYKQCNKKSSSAFTAAAGIAAANMYTLIPFISLFLVHVYLCLGVYFVNSEDPVDGGNNCNGRRGKNEGERKFKRSDKEAAIDMVADSILDELYQQKYGGEDDHKHNSTTSKTIRDLSSLLRKKMAAEHMNSAIYMSSFVQEFGSLVDDTYEGTVVSTLHKNMNSDKNYIDVELPSMTDTGETEFAVVPAFMEDGKKDMQQMVMREEKVNTTGVNMKNDS